MGRREGRRRRVRDKRKGGEKGRGGKKAYFPRSAAGILLVLYVWNGGGFEKFV